MRKITFLLAFCFMTFAASAQLMDVVTGLGFPYGIEIDGNNLYVAELTSNKISKVDISAPNPVAETFITTLGPGGMLIDGNDLYFAKQSGGIIYKANLLDANPTPVEIVNLGYNAGGLYLKGTDLYITSTTAQLVVKLDLTQPNPTPQVILNTGLSTPLGITGKDDYLLVSNFSLNNVVKIDLTNPNPTPEVIISGSGLANPGGLTLNGNYLYIAHDGSGGAVSRIDLADENPVLDDVATGLNGPRLSIFNGTDIYITEANGGKVSKLTINEPVFSTLPAVCEGSTNAQLGGASPTGGVYSGNGVTDNGDGQHFTFNAVAAGGVGSYTVTYTINGFSTTATVEVTALPTVTFSLADTLYMTAAMPLTGLGGGMPTGGVYTDQYSEINDDGNGMTFSFNSSVYVDASNNITYTYTDANGCQNSVTELVYVSSAVSGVLKLSDLQASLFPNPTYGPAVWSGVEAKFVRILNQEGRQVLAQKITKQEVDLSSLPNGIYSLLLQLDNDQWVRAQVVKQ
jgi:hypothetical protein